MIKKLVAVLAACIMLFGTVTVMAAKTGDVVFNGDFELGSLSWSMPPEACIVSDQHAYDGNSIRIRSTGNAFAHQYIDLIEGEEYEVVLMAKAFDNGGAIVKFEMYQGNNWAAADGTNWEITSQWGEYSYKFTVPAGINRAQMLIRLIGGGTVYYDNVRVIGALSSRLESGTRDRDAEANEVFKDERAKYAKAEDAYGKNFVYNGGFELVDTNSNPEAIEFSGEWGGSVSKLTEKPHGGNIALQLTSNSNAPVSATLHSDKIVGGFPYQLNFFYKGENTSKDLPFGFVFEGYTTDNADEAAKLFTAHTYDLPAVSAWTHVTYNFNVPATCRYITFSPVVYAKNATMHVDDISFYMTQAPELFEYDTDQIFYYSHLKTGMAKVILKDVFDNKGYTADFNLYDGDKVIVSAKNVAVNEDKEANWLFDLGWLSEKEKAYVLKMEAKNEKGEVISSYSQNVYKYDKPEAMTDNGTFVVDGKPYYPAIIYHVDTADKMETAPQIGLNLVQAVYNGSDGIPGWIQMLDDYHARGFKCAIVCYWGMKHAGDPVNVKRVSEFIEAIKDHPAVFCYMTMDEPMGHYPDNEDTKKIMETAYTMIRSIDPVHPIYSCESSIDHYKMAFKYNDVVGIDPYPGSGKPFETHVADATVIAENHSDKFDKGIIQILQTFTYGKRPSETNLHSMMYQSLMGGADANGIYPWVMDNAELDGYALPDTVWYGVFEDFMANEYDVTWKHYGKTGQTEWFYTTKENDYWIDMWVDGKDVYAAVLNRLAEDQVISVPTTSQNGLVTLENYEVTPADSALTAPIEKKENSIDITMPASAALLFKITSGTDLSKVSEFGDLATYDWAAEAINAMFGAGIANDKGEYVYEPGTPITRGDFAMYLVNALGIDEKVVFTDNFKDVPATAEYAAAIAAGKKAGILNGVGNNYYSPELPITRQDLLVICARGMRYIKNLAEADASVLESFSDKALLADYAAADVAAMVNAGIVKGNADGTVNPLGNTTRAEAAIIMSRIVEWSK